MAQRIACIVLVKLQKTKKLPTAVDLARTVEMGTTIGLPPMEIGKTINAMLDHGSRYMNMEKVLGTGMSLVLGCYLPESYWKKLMKKSGSLFDSVVAQIEQTEAIQLASDYAPLQEAIVRQTMAALMQEKNRGTRWLKEAPCFPTRDP